MSGAKEAGQQQEAGIVGGGASLNEAQKMNNFY